MTVSPETIYEVWHEETFKAKGINVRKVKNFDKAKEKDDWKCFVLCADMINRNNGTIDYKTYIQALAKFHKGWFQPQLLINHSSIRIYTSYVQDLESESRNSIESIKSSIENSYKFIIKYCIENKMSINQYLNHDKELIPTFLKHVNNGSISKNVIGTISNITIIINSYPQDVINDYFIDFEEVYKQIRSTLVTNNKLRYLSNEKFFKNMEEYVRSKLK